MGNTAKIRHRQRYRAKRVPRGLRRAQRFFARWFERMAAWEARTGRKASYPIQKDRSLG